MRYIPIFIMLFVAASALSGCSDDASAPAADTPTAGTATASTSGPTPSSTATDDPAIVIDLPLTDAAVDVPFEISGSANVFEAALIVQVLAPNGALLCARNIMATSGSGTRGTWATTMAFAVPAGVAGELPVRIRALSLSARDGSEENVVEREVNVGAEPPNIVIEEPACGASVSKRAGLDVSGMADVFEAALTLELHDAAGNSVLTQNVMSTGGQMRSPFVALLDLSGSAIVPGPYDLVALSFSARDGARENVFAVPIVITP